MKGQVAFEVVMYSMIASLMVILIVSVINVSYINQSKDRATQELISVGRSIQREIIIASDVSPGYTREFTIPQKILQYDINIKNSNYEFELEILDSSRVWQIPEVSGNLTLGKNTLKYDGVVVKINE